MLEKIYKMNIIDYLKDEYNFEFKDFKQLNNQMVAIKTCNISLNTMTDFLPNNYNCIWGDKEIFFSITEGEHVMIVYKMKTIKKDNMILKFDSPNNQVIAEFYINKNLVEKKTIQFDDYMKLLL